MIKGGIFKLLAAGAALNVVVDESAAKALRPNVVIILADDHRHDWMGHKGTRFMETPNLDRLAKEGVSFANAFACSGVCSPSRASIFTGRYAHRASAPGIVWCNNSFLLGQTMFPQLLQKAGYTTGYIGKFHLGQDSMPKPRFDYWAGFDFVGEFFNQTITINGKQVPAKGFTDDHIAGLAAEWIKSQSQSGNPFCLVVGLKAPHIPYKYPDRMKAKLADTVFSEPASYALRKPGLESNCIYATSFPPAIPAYGSFQEWVRSYSRLALTLDESVGTVVGALEKSGVLDNTFFVYLSDQGYSLGEFGLCEKHYAYDQIMRIPLVVRYPLWISSGSRKEQMVLTIDLAPTVLDLCGVPAPAGMDGRSWRTLFTGTGSSWREDFLFDYASSFPIPLPPMQAVRTATHKLIEYQEKPIKELYDMKNDPLEKENLYNKPGMETVHADLEARLVRLKKETGWNPVRSRRLLEFHLLGPVTEPQDKSLQSRVSALSRPVPVTADGQEWSWRKMAVDGQGGYDLSSLKKGEVFYIAVPLERMTDYDPFVELEFFLYGSGARRSRKHFPMEALYQGQVVWQNNEHRALSGKRSVGFNDQCNYPLPEKIGMVLFRCVMAEGFERIDTEITAPENAIRIGGG
jgi:N-acetylglucosamine-6-sulfatase